MGGEGFDTEVGNGEGGIAKSEAEFETPLDFAGPGKVGCLGLGTAAVTVMDETVSMIDFLHNACRFFAHESCGQCTPCREGTGWLYRILNRIEHGAGRHEDLPLLLNLADNIQGRTICALGDAAAWPVQSFLKHFRHEFQYMIEHKGRSIVEGQPPAAAAAA